MRTNGYDLRRTWILALAGGAALGGTAAADIIETRIIRSLDAEARASSGDDRDLSAPKPIISDDFGLFDFAHDARAITHDERALAEILAVQESFAEPDDVRGRVATEGAARTRGDNTESRGAGGSELNYTFTLTEPARFVLNGDYIIREGEGDFVNHSSVVLVPLNDSDFEPIRVDDPGHFRFLGLLPHGEYRFGAQANLVVEAGGEQFSSLTAVIEFAYRMSECLADLNADGELDAEDFFLFLDLFAEDDPSVDLNGDGTIDSEDFFAYLDLFVHGCR